MNAEKYFKYDYYLDCDFVIKGDKRVDLVGDERLGNVKQSIVVEENKFEEFCKRYNPSIHVRVVSKTLINGV